MEVLEQRASTHGSFAEGAVASQAIKGMFRRWGDKFTVELEGVDNIVQKIVRLKFGASNNIDTWRDIAGYAQLVVDNTEDNTIMPFDDKVGLTSIQETMLGSCNSEDCCDIQMIVKELFDMANSHFYTVKFMMIRDIALKQVEQLKQTEGAIDVDCKKIIVSSSTNKGE